MRMVVLRGKKALQTMGRSGDIATTADCSVPSICRLCYLVCSALYVVVNLDGVNSSHTPHILNSAAAVCVLGSITRTHFGLP